jgi:predicted acylesterase/phospholipase RssA
MTLEPGEQPKAGQGASSDTKLDSIWAMLVQAGADVVLSVNIMSRDTLPAWPGEQPPEPATRRSGSRMLDTLLEVMDLSQLDASVRHAARADVVVTPRFGPCTWRDFHLADLFLAAGRRAAEEQLAALRALARPQAPALSISAV